MKNPLLALLILFLVVAGCKRDRNQVLLDSEIPPDEQLIKISARDLAKDYAHGKTRSSSNRADEKYLNKWMKVNGTVDSFYDKKDGFGYTVEFDTFAGDPDVVCVGNYEGKNSEITLEDNQEVSVVGKLGGGGNARTLTLNPCKVIK
ncbi:MAG TPA: hypothetical protein VJT71_00265 [Pyrinomonadaceae bacterium]|nr:hypothetical protein [Pyrinomonadaceae bacterium]